MNISEFLSDIELLLKLDKKNTEVFLDDLLIGLENNIYELNDNDKILMNYLIQSVKYEEENRFVSYQYINKLIELFPENASIYHTRGLLIGRKYHNLKEAIKDFDIAIKLNKNHTSSFLDRAICYYQLGEFENSIKDLNKILEINDKKYNSKAHYYLANINKKLKNYDKSEFHYTQSIINNKFEYLSYIGRANLYKELKKNPELVEIDLITASNIKNKIYNNKELEKEEMHDKNLLKINKN
jgi:tetratricopeptide (TPR) repeat protein